MLPAANCDAIVYPVSDKLAELSLARGVEFSVGGATVAESQEDIDSLNANGRSVDR